MNEISEFQQLLNDNDLKLKFCCGLAQVDESDFGIWLSWNETANWYQPYLGIGFGKRIFQLGFLYDSVT